MSAEVDQLIVKAIHALDTGQPRLAGLYITKARVLVGEERVALHRAKFQRVMGAFATQVYEAYVGAVARTGDAFTAFTTAYAEADAKLSAQQLSAVRRRDHLSIRPTRYRQ